MGLTITNTGARAIRFLEWGLEGPLTYNPATSLMLDSDNLVTTGFAGTQTTRSGAYDPNASGNQVIGATIHTYTTAILGTGNQAHVGSFRVKARVQSWIYTQIRLSWQVGDGPFTANAWQTTPGHDAGGWFELDLGTITVPEIEGTQRWTGRLEARTTQGADSPVIDYLALIPVTAGYGKARATYAWKAGVLAAYDTFTGLGSGAALNGRTPDAGSGNWTTSGAATDFTGNTATLTGVTGGESPRLTRATVSDAGFRWAVWGANMTDQEVGVLTWGSRYTRTSIHAVIARWTDANNHLRFQWTGPGTQAPGTLELVKVVAGVETVLASSSGLNGGSVAVLRLIAFASGRIIGRVEIGGSLAHELTATDTVAATGGALASGKGGVADKNPSATAWSRYYDNAGIDIPAPEPVVIYPGQSLEVSGVDVTREDATGTYVGRPQSYRGSRVRIPVGTSRIVVRAAYEDLDTTASSTTSVPIEVQVSCRPRGLVIPRS